jgi:hypothetical protein
MLLWVKRIPIKDASRLVTEKIVFSFGHAIIHESVPASQFNFLCPSLLFTARPFFATLFFRDPRLFGSSINEGRRRKNRRRLLRKRTAANKDGGNGYDCECSKRWLHGSSQ